MDRAHRIGQTRTVNVYRLIAQVSPSVHNRCINPFFMFYWVALLFHSFLFSCCFPHRAPVAVPLSATRSPSCWPLVLVVDRVSLERIGFARGAHHGGAALQARCGQLRGAPPAPHPPRRVRSRRFACRAGRHSGLQLATRQVSQDNAALGSMDTSALLDGFASAAAPPPPAVAVAAAGGAPGAPRRRRGGKAADRAVIAEAGLEGAGGGEESGVSGEDELEAQYEVCSHLPAVPPAAICSLSPHPALYRSEKRLGGVLGFRSEGGCCFQSQPQPLLERFAKTLRQKTATFERSVCAWHTFW
jgi:hypothetical protein